MTDLLPRRPDHIYEPDQLTNIYSLDRPRERNGYVKRLAGVADAVVGAIRPSVEAEAKCVAQGFDIGNSPVGWIVPHPIKQFFATPTHYARL